MCGTSDSEYLVGWVGGYYIEDMKEYGKIHTVLRGCLMLGVGVCICDL